MTDIAIPTALDVLRTQIYAHGTLADLALPLRALQHRGLSKVDLIVHVERLRVQNDLTHQDDDVEENCLRALDLINGGPSGLGLKWDAAHTAAALLPRCLNTQDLERACRYAIEPSDLLPPRPRFTSAEVPVFKRMAASVFDATREFRRLPVAAEFHRAPKDAFTTRPAAVLALDDQILLEALTYYVEQELDRQLPASVLWPRSRLQRPEGAALAALTKTWRTPYIAKADISAFYENVDHELLAVLLVGQLGIAVTKARAIESLLSAVMGSSRGLPQGPASSDALASSFLLGVDRELDQRRIRYRRYADDYFFPARSVSDGQRTLRILESLIGDIGLSLNSAKTQVMRKDTYERGLRRPSPAVERLKERLTDRRISSLMNMEESDDLVDALREAGLDEEDLFDVFYHETTRLEDVLEGARSRLGPSLNETYEIYLRRIGRMLETGDLEAEPSALAALARECLLVLMSSTESDVDPDDLNQLLTWFPSLVPLVSDYIISRSGRISPEMRGLVTSWLRKPSGMDWFDAWICRSAGAPGLVKYKTVVSRLRKILLADSTPSLTRIEAARSLASGNHLDADEWGATFLRVSPAMRSELFLTAISNLDDYPWMSDALATVADPGQEPIGLSIRAIGALDPPREQEN